MKKSQIYVILALFFKLPGISKSWTIFLFSSSRYQYKEFGGGPGEARNVFNTSIDMLIKRTFMAIFECMYFVTLEFGPQISSTAGKIIHICS